MTTPHEPRMVGDFVLTSADENKEVTFSGTLFARARRSYLSSGMMMFADAASWRRKDGGAVMAFRNGPDPDFYPEGMWELDQWLFVQLIGPTSGGDPDFLVLDWAQNDVEADVLRAVDPR